jgi:hypothetical protein
MGRELCLLKARVPPEHRATTSRFMREASVHTERTRDVTPAAPGRLGNEHRRHDRRARLDEKVHQVLGGNKAGTVACGLPAGLPARWNGR